MHMLPGLYNLLVRIPGIHIVVCHGITHFYQLNLLVMAFKDGTPSLVARNFQQFREKARVEEHGTATFASVERRDNAFARCPVPGNQGIEHARGDHGLIAKHNERAINCIRRYSFLIAIR